jgi:hypothetical protein
VAAAAELAAVAGAVELAAERQVKPVAQWAVPGPPVRPDKGLDKAPAHRAQARPAAAACRALAA